jgi:hypothetical protein
MYSLAALGVVLGALLTFAIRGNIRRNAATGDFAGAGLGTAFLLVDVLPLALAALALALWLAPPRRVRRGSNAGGSGQPTEAAPSPRGWSAHAMLLAGLLLAGVALVAIVGTMLADALRGAYRYYGLRGAGLIGLGVQDLIVFSPLLVLAGVLFWIARAVAHSRPAG